MKLPLGAVLEGIVLGPDGQPDASWLFLVVDGDPPQVSKHAAKQGEFRIEGLEPDTYRLVAAWQVYEDLLLSPSMFEGRDTSGMIQAEETVTLAPGEVRQLTLQKQ